MHVHKIIVIHPGSQNLRVGLASDVNPITILHAIARRKLSEDAAVYQDTLLPSVQEDADFEAHRLHVTHSLQSLYVAYRDELPRGGKHLRVSTPPQQIAAFNKHSVPEEFPLDDEDDRYDAKRIKLDDDAEDDTAQTTTKETLFDGDILKLSTQTDSAQYNVHFPMRRGELNLHNGIGGSMQAVLADLEAIWLHAITQRMGISAGALPQYNAVLVIPDIYHRSHLRELVTLLLQRLRFRGCFLLQDHVAATFGAGLSYACVVDVGDQKCSISCVEDGISHPDTRVRLSYGGGDITQVFHALLRKCCFPYKRCDAAANIADAALLTQLKEQNCHLNLNVCGAQERTFEVQQPAQQRLLQYKVQLGDECIVAPLGLFHTELLNITGRQKLARIQLRASQQPDSEDCFDAEYIRETGRRNGGRDQLLLDGSSMLPITGGEVGEEELVVDDVNDREAYAKSDAKEEILFMPNGQIIPLDQAVVRCIERCANDEMKRKMYASILLVGGGVKASGFNKLLERKVTLQLGSTQLRAVDQLPPFEVNVLTKEMDARMIAWKGAAIMSCLESAPELWIYNGEWDKCGLRILREKAPFIW